MAVFADISREDWERVTELAFGVVNESFYQEPPPNPAAFEMLDKLESALGLDGKLSEAQPPSARAALFQFLDCLDEKYGEHPKLLATRADFLDNDPRRENLWLRAYELTSEAGHIDRLPDLAHSLAEFYVEERQDAAHAACWLAVFQSDLRNADEGGHLQEELFRLQQLFRSRSQA